MRRKVLAAFLAVSLMGAGLSGCGGAQDSSGNAGKADAQGADNQEADNGGAGEEAGGAKESAGDRAAEGDLVEIVWQWPSSGSTGSGFQDVEDALNAMMEKDIGVHVTLYPVNASNLANQTALDVSAGEQVDLCLSIGTGVGSLVSNGFIVPLDDIINEHGAAIVEKCDVGLSGGYYDGKLYGMPIAYIRGSAYGYLARKDILDKYNITIDKDKHYTLDEIETIFATVKAGEGDNFFCMIPAATSEAPLHRCAFEYDKLGGTTASGVLMLNESFEDLTVKNMYESEAYGEYARRMYDWAQKGYISKDAATNTEPEEVMIASGNYMGLFYWTTPGACEELSQLIGTEMVQMQTIEPYTPTDDFQSVLWSVPITSTNPEKAVEALNYIYEHNEAAALLQYGIEGQSYEIIQESEEGKVFRYLSDDITSLPYYCGYGVYGDRLSWPVIEGKPINANAELKVFSDGIPDSRRSPAMGYCFNYESVATEFSAVTAVISQYITSINCGVIDPDKILPEFQEALKAAGIEKVIAENQRQMDEWKAANR